MIAVSKGGTGSRSDFAASKRASRGHEVRSGKNEPHLYQASDIVLQEV